MFIQIHCITTGKIIDPQSFGFEVVETMLGNEDCARQTTMIALKNVVLYDASV